MSNQQIAEATAVSERVLVVDDSLVIRKAIERKLKTDFDLIMANNGEAAWEILARDESIKVLITDIEMPGLDGYGLICRIRAAEQPQLRNLPIIAITGADDEETKARAFACGATDFIIKPIDPLQLQARVHAHVKFNDTTRKLAEVEATLEDQAITDPLTLLSSRRYFLQRGEQDLAHAVRHGSDMVLARLDIDRLKHIYTQYGDEAVDQLLAWIAGTLKHRSRSEDTIARIGGAEFAFLAPSTGRAQGEIVCNRMRMAVAASPFRFNDQAIAVTVSIGLVSLAEDRPRSLEEMLELADRCLANAKSEGGDRLSATILGAGVARPEELTLVAPDAPAVAEDLVSMVESSVPPLSELDDLLLSDAGADGSQAGVSISDLENSSVPADIVELLSIDRALLMLANGDSARLGPWLHGLARRVIPLLELCNRERSLGLDAALANIKRKLPDQPL